MKKILFVFMLSFTFSNALINIGTNMSTTPPTCDGGYWNIIATGTDYYYISPKSWQDNYYKQIINSSDWYHYALIERTTYESRYDQFRIRCTPNPTCAENEVLDTSDFHQSVCVPAPCPPGTTDDGSNPEIPNCVCDSGVPYYDINGFVGCEQGTCPTSYDGNPPLPLFATVSTPNECNFFTLSDGAILDLNGLICCYGQEGEELSNCPLNSFEINGDCYPITPNEEDPEVDTTCPRGFYWSIAYEQCVEWFPENNSTNPDGSPSATAGDTDGDGTLDNVAGDGSYDGDGDYGIDMDGVESALSDILTSYVLIDLPVSISSNCGDEFKKTFTLPVTGQSYSIDVAQHISTIEEYAPMIKAIILFMFSLSGVLIVLSGNKE